MSYISILDRKLNIYLIILFTEDLHGIQKLCIVGDNFVAENYRTYFKKWKTPMYIKENYEISCFCSSKYNDKNVNALSRLQITLAAAINKVSILPNYIFIIIDDDMINYLSYQGSGFSSLMGEWIEWLIKGLQEMIQACKENLPKKCKSDYNPQVYWVAAPKHSGFSFEVGDLRTKFNFCLESVIKQNKNMRVIKFKDNWRFEDKELVVNNKFTIEGMYSYWRAVDAAFKFNVKKRDEYLARQFLKGSTPGQQRQKTDNDQFKKTKYNKDEMKKFFDRKKVKHWAKESMREDPQDNRSGNRFMLPRPK